MSFFSNSKTVVGLFDNDKDVERAINELADHGFGGENSDDTVEVIDRYLFSDGDISAQVIAVPIPSTGGSTGAGIVIDSGAENKSNSSAMVEQIQKILTDMNVDQEQATFYANRVARGGSLIVVESDAERIAEALNILTRVSTKGSVS